MANLLICSILHAPYSPDSRNFAVRRRLTPLLATPCPANVVEGVRSNPLPASGLKHRHDSSDGDLPVPHKNGGDLHNEVKRLRRETKEKDRRLEQLERIVTDLQQAIHPPPALDHDLQLTQAMPPSATQVTKPQP